jgi:predicted dehydrogenase
LNPLRVGLSGCGRRGAEVVRNVRTHAHCDVVALHDPDPAALQHLGDATGIAQRDTDFEAMLATGVDFVVLAGPPGDRLPQVAAAAEQGAHCLLHAPMAIDGKAAAAMVAACDRAGVKLGVAVPPQADPIVEQIRRMIADDWMGAPVLVTSVFGDDAMLREPPPEGHWRRDPLRAGGNAFVQLAAESVHLAVWLTERRPSRCVAVATSGFTTLPHDSVAAAVELRGGVLCTFAASHLCSGRAFAIHGTDGSVLLAADRRLLRGRKAFSGEAFDYPTPHEEVILPREREVDPLSVHYELHGRFARWIDDRDDFPCPGDQAAEDMAALDSMAQAIERRNRDPG